MLAPTQHGDPEMTQKRAETPEASLEIPEAPREMPEASLEIMVRLPNGGRLGAEDIHLIEAIRTAR